MRLGLVCPYNLFKGGGVQECVLAIREELSKRGHSALIITPQPRVTPKRIPSYVRLLGHSTDVKSPFHTTGQISVSVDPRQIEILRDHEAFDILHFHEPWIPLIAWQLLRRTDAVNIATFHAKLPESVVSKTIEKVVTPYTKSVVKYFDALTAVSPSAAEYVRDLTTNDVTIIPNGIDLAKYNVQAPKRQTAKPMILYIGRLEKRKGVTHLLDAFAELQRQVLGVKLMIAGDGPDREKLETKAKRLGLTNVKFLGYISEAKKRTLLQEANLFVSPALYGESFGIVLLEAMAAGVPIVAGNNPGYGSVLAGRGQISLVDPKHAAVFADRMKLLLTDETLRAAWKQWAFSSIKQYDYKRVVDKYEQLYLKLSRA